MPRYTLPTDSGLNFSEGFDVTLVYIASQVPIFIPLFLFSFFMITMLGGFYLEKVQTAREDFPKWFATGGFLTLLLAITMTLRDGLITLDILIVTFAVAVLSVIWLMTTRDQR